MELFVAVNVELLPIVGGEAEAQSGRDSTKAERSAVTGPREDASGDGWRSQATSRGVVWGVRRAHSGQQVVATRETKTFGRENG